MVTISDFNYASMAEQLQRGANGEDRQDVLLGIKSCIKGTTPDDIKKSFRSIYDSLVKLSGETFMIRCEATRQALINGLEKESYDPLELFCNDYTKWKEEKEEEDNERRQMDEAEELGLDPMDV